MPDELLEAKQTVLSLVKKIDRLSLPTFVGWLDMKIAEFKIFGYIINDVREYGESHLSIVNTCTQKRVNCDHSNKCFNPQRSPQPHNNDDCYIVNPAGISTTYSSSNNGKTSNSPTRSPSNYNKANSNPAHRYHHINESINEQHKHHISKSNDVNSVETPPPVPVVMESISADSRHVSISLSFFDETENQCQPPTQSQSSLYGFQKSNEGDIPHNHSNVQKSVKEVGMGTKDHVFNVDDPGECLYKSDQFKDIISQSDYKMKEDYVDTDPTEELEVPDQFFSKGLDHPENKMVSNADNSHYNTTCAGISTNESVKESSFVSAVLAAESSSSGSDMRLESETTQSYITISPEPLMDDEGDEENHEESVDDTLGAINPVPVPIALVENFSGHQAKAATVGKHRDDMMCNICGAMFKMKSSLFRHKTIHGKKKFGCYICGKMFHRREHVRKHFTGHARRGDLLCFLCNFQSPSLKDLEDHALHKHSILNLFKVHENPEYSKILHWKRGGGESR